MTKNIAAIGFSLDSSEVEEIDMGSNETLSDWEIILFRPTFEERDLRDYNFFDEVKKHWKTRLYAAVYSGKTVMLFLPEIISEAADYSPFPNTNYDGLPFKINVESGSGKRFDIPSYNKTKVFSMVLGDLSKLLNYKVIIKESKEELNYLDFDCTPCLYTYDRQHIVGFIMRHQSGGSFVVLPDIDLDIRSKIDMDNILSECDYSHEYEKKRMNFLQSFIGTVTRFDKLLHKEADVSPPPKWATNAIYDSEKEMSLRQELVSVERQLQQALADKQCVQGQISCVAQLRALLYAQGDQLETAIIKALRLLGFQAEGYCDGTLELDVVFTAEEGRFLGEAEGKDRSAIDIRKLNQLTGNISDDDNRSDVKEGAKGILFGNGQRLLPPQERGEIFTDNCIQRSEARNIALVDTRDLFKVAQYLVDNPDEVYKKQCRVALAQKTGVFKFPDLPIP